MSLTKEQRRQVQAVKDLEKAIEKFKRSMPFAFEDVAAMVAAEKLEKEQRNEKYNQEMAKLEKAEEKEFRKRSLRLVPEGWQLDHASSDARGWCYRRGPADCLADRAFDEPDYEYRAVPGRWKNQYALCPGNPIKFVFEESSFTIVRRKKPLPTSQTEKCVACDGAGWVLKETPVPVNGDREASERALFNGEGGIRNGHH